MTSLVALATKDALVLGCDSLGTTTRDLIDPFDLVDYFDSEKRFKLKIDDNGNPILKDFTDIYQKANPLPYTHMTHMTKLLSLSPLKMGIMTTGIASIGDRTIKSLLKEFKHSERAFGTEPKPANYTVKSIANKILKFINEFYEKQFPEEERRPDLEFILGGYDKRSQIPKIVRVRFPGRKIEESLEKSKFGIVFGGQMREIQRIVFGSDVLNKREIFVRHIKLLRKYREKMNEFLKQNNISMEIPELSMEEIDELDMFKDGWDLDGFNANWGDFSEQNAIECVDFFVNIMIKSQQFSEGMPTVGGEVHIALITKAEGFRFISKEGYFHGEYFVPKETKNI